MSSAASSYMSEYSEGYIEANELLQTGGVRYHYVRHHPATLRWGRHLVYTRHSALPHHWAYAHVHKSLYVRKSDYYHDRDHVTYARIGHHHNVWRDPLYHHVTHLIHHHDLHGMSSRRLIEQAAISSLMDRTSPHLPFVASSMTTVKTPLGSTGYHSVTLNGPFPGITSVHSTGPGALMGSYINDWKADRAVAMFRAQEHDLTVTNGTLHIAAMSVAVTATQHTHKVYSSTAFPVQQVYGSAFRWMMKDLSHFLKEWACFLPLYGVLRFNPMLQGAMDSKNPDVNMVKLMQKEMKASTSAVADGKRITIKSDFGNFVSLCQTI